MAEQKNTTFPVALILADRPVEGWEDAFRPMARIAGTTMIKKQIASLRKAGVTSLYILTGFQHEALERHVVHLGVTCLYQPHFRDDDPLSSLQTALRDPALAAEDELFVLPADTSLFLPKTLTEMAEKKGDAVVPCSDERTGFPLLLRKKAMEALLAGKEGEKILEILSGDKLKLCRFETEDEGCFLRFLTDEDYERMTAYAEQQKTSNALSFNLKVSLFREEDFFGPGTAHFLELVDSKGSMLAACEEMQMSYSKGWKMVRQVEEQMGFPFLIRQTGGKDGGSSRLTEEGRDFVRRYTALKNDLKRTAEAFFSLYFSDFQ